MQPFADIPLFEFQISSAALGAAWVLLGLLHLIKPRPLGPLDVRAVRTLGAVTVILGIAALISSTMRWEPGCPQCSTGPLSSRHISVGFLIWLAWLGAVVIANFASRLRSNRTPTHDWTQFTPRPAGGRLAPIPKPGRTALHPNTRQPILPPTFLGGVRRDSFHATKPLVRLTVELDGITIEPSWRFLAVLGAPRLKIGWNEIGRVEPCRELFSTGVRFYGPWRKLIFWISGAERTRALAACETARPGKVQRAPQT